MSIEHTRVRVNKKAAKQRMPFEEAKRTYTHRYTMEHVPKWAKKPCEGHGRYYAPQYRSDAEWYTHTLFPPESGHPTECWSQNQTWPLGLWLDKPYEIKGK